MPSAATAAATGATPTTTPAAPASKASSGDPVKDFSDRYDSVIDLAVRNGLSPQAQMAAIQHKQLLLKQGADLQKLGDEHYAAAQKKIETLNNDTAGAVKSLEAIPEGSDRDAAYSNIREQIAAAHPDVAATLPPAGTHIPDALLQQVSLAHMVGSQAWAAFSAAKTANSRETAADAGKTRANLAVQEKVPLLAAQEMGTGNDADSWAQKYAQVQQKVKDGKLPQDVLDRIPQAFSTDNEKKLQDNAVSPTDKVKIPNVTQTIDEYIQNNPTTDGHPTTRADADAAIAAKRTKATGQVRMDMEGSDQAVANAGKKAGAVAKATQPFRAQQDKTAQRAQNALNTIRQDATAMLTSGRGIQQGDTLETIMERLAKKYYQSDIKGLSEEAHANQQSEEDQTKALQDWVNK